MSSTGLGTAYANVVDYGAMAITGSRAEEDANRGFIQAAINSGRHVLFPAGTYRFRGGAITFLNADQRCTFLAGAILQPADSSSHVVVSAARQVLTGLRIETPADVAAHSPLLDVQEASGVRFQEPRISVFTISDSEVGPRCAMRVAGLSGCLLIGGRISGTAQAHSVGLSFTSSVAGDADQVAAVGLSIALFAWAVRIGRDARNPTFVGCEFANNVSGAVLVTDDGDVAVALTELAFIRQVGGRFQPGPAVVANATVVRGLALVGCRMYGGAPPRFVAVSADLGTSNPGGAIEGGVVMGCTFGVAVAATSGGEGQATSKAVAGASSVPPLRVGRTAAVNKSIAGAAQAKSSKSAVAQGQAQSESDGDCIFEIKGSVTGLVVSGCYSAPDGLRASAWRIPAGAALSTCCDMFNTWAEADVALGDNQHLLPRMSTNELGRLTLTADEVSVDTTAIGFFGAAPAASGVVTGSGGPAVRGDRTLSARTAQLVLQQLVRDLVDLGLVYR